VSYVISRITYIKNEKKFLYRDEVANHNEVERREGSNRGFKSHPVHTFVQNGRVDSSQIEVENVDNK
jgi:hypothetical protein